MDINKLRDLSPKFQKGGIEYTITNTSEALHDLASSKVLNYCLHENKSGIKAKVTPKVLNDWIKKEIVLVSDVDKGKVKRFDKLEIIWLHLVVDLRKFGVPLDKIKYIRQQLLYKVKNFSYLKYSVLKTILGEDDYMLVFETGEISFINIETYYKLTKRGRFPMHITIRLIDYVKKEFDNNTFDTDYNYLYDIDHLEKLKLLFFLKTNLYQVIRLTISKGDTRLILNSNDIEDNAFIKKALTDWKFDKVTIIIDDYSEVDIINTTNSSNGK